MTQMKRTFHLAGESVSLVLAGTALIAVTYGMARFGVGLLHPAMAATRPGLAEALPAAGGAQFSAYCLAAGVGGRAAARHARLVALAAGGTAAVGSLGLAAVASAAAFVVSAFVAGAAAGLASPALVVLLDATLPPRFADAAQAVVNAGTSVGVVTAGVLAGIVRSPTVAWLLVAVLALAVAGVVAGLAGRGSGAVGVPAVERAAPTARGSWASQRVPVVAAVVVGVASTAVWTYGPTVVVGQGGLHVADAGLLWLAVGAGGLAGALVSRLVDRCGPAGAFAWCAGAHLVSTAGVLVSGPIAVRLVAAAGFGAAYMAQTGALILWARRLDPARGGELAARFFIALAVGQALGSYALTPVLG